MICCAVARSESDTFRAYILTWVSSLSPPSQNNLFQWHNEENSSYTATALYGNLTRFHKHLAYITPNANNIFIFGKTVYFLFPNANIIICFCQFVVNNFFGVCFIHFLILTFLLFP